MLGLVFNQLFFLKSFHLNTSKVNSGINIYSHIVAVHWLNMPYLLLSFLPEDTT